MQEVPDYKNEYINLFENNTLSPMYLDKKTYVKLYISIKGN